jgi:peptide/nickel transport system ATP-binding protein
MSELPLLDVRNLRVGADITYPGEDSHHIVLVDDVSFKLKKGHVLGLIGESGAGKSTIGLTSLAFGRGGCEITGGEIWFKGTNILTQSARQIRQYRGVKVAYVAQSAAAAFNPAHRLGDQVIESALEHKLMSRAEATAFANQLFAKLGLPDPDSFGRRYPPPGLRRAAAARHDRHGALL